MGTAEKWVLLANAYDETNIRDKLVYDFANQIDFAWSPECKFVDLYVNGEYYGLYLLSEKVEIGADRLDISQEDSFLFSSKQSVKWKSSTIGFQTDEGRDMVVNWPKECSQAQLSALQDKINLIESLIIDSKDNGLFEYIDLDSWARRYLIDEIFFNLDSEIASSYYYWDTSDETNKIYAGPIWDYDLSLGNTNSEWSKMWDTTNRLVSQISSRTWYQSLMKNEVFKNRVIELYTKEFKPLLTQLQTTGIDYWISQTYDSEKMNSIRWKNQLSTIFESREEAVNAMKKFLQERVEFLNSIWCENITYHTVVVVVGDNISYSFEVEENNTFQQLPDPEELGITGFTGWYDESTGEEFNLDLPITEDKVIRAEVDTSILSKLIDLISNHKYILLVLFLCAIFGFLGLILLYADFNRNRRRAK